MATSSAARADGFTVDDHVDSAADLVWKHLQLCRVARRGGMSAAPVLLFARAKCFNVDDLE